MKKFLAKISYTIFPLWLLTVGVVTYLSLYVTPNIHGDIGVLAYIPFGHDYDANLEREMLKETLFSTIDKTDKLKQIHVHILNIGDSFSQLGKSGHQNYLCNKGLTLVNCQRDLYSSPLQYAYNIMDMNVIDSTNAKILIVETAERDFEKYIEDFDIAKTDMNELDTTDSSILGAEANNWSIGRVKDPNTWSISRARDWIMYKIGNSMPIYTAQLNDNLFSSEEPNKLYFYCYDIINGVSIKQNNKKKVNQVFNTLRDKAQEKGMSFILMVAVDKYDLYQKYIVDNSFPIKTVNEDIERILGNNPNLFLTKHCLLPLLERKEKDVFRFTDTHWSYKASETIAEALYQHILSTAKP
jgi:hypothetical protein